MDSEIVPEMPTEIIFWYIDPMLFECWSTVCDVGPTFKQHWVIGSCLLGFVFQSRPYLKWRTKHLYYNRIRIIRLVGLWTNPLTIFLFPVTHCIPHAKHWHSDMVVTLLKTLKDVFWWRNLAFNQWSSQFLADVFVHYKWARHQPNACSMLVHRLRRRPSPIQYRGVLNADVNVPTEYTLQPTQWRLNVGPASPALASFDSIPDRASKSIFLLPRTYSCTSVTLLHVFCMQQQKAYRRLGAKGSYLPL